MNVANIRKRLYALLLSLCFIAITRTSAEDISHGLVYLRNLDTDKYQIVFRIAEEAATITVTQDDCPVISPQVQYLAVGNKRTNTIVIYHFNLDLTPYQLPTLATNPCGSIRWLSNELLGFTDNQKNVSAINAHTYELIPTATWQQPADSNPAASITDRAPDDLLLVSPNGRFVVYNQCKVGQFDLRDDSDYYCVGEQQIVIHDVSRSVVIMTLAEVSQYQFSLVNPQAFDGIAWSPTGRYLAYITGNSQEPIQVYDTLQMAYVSIEDNFNPLTQIDPLVGFAWTLNEQSVAFVLNDYNDNTKSIVSVEIESGKVTRFSAPDGAIFGLGRGWESETLTYIDELNQLTVFSLVTGETQIADTNVVRLFNR
jgi:hypothetical protein